jgi:hypothetical protein
MLEQVDLETMTIDGYHFDYRPTFDELDCFLCDESIFGVCRSFYQSSPDAPVALVAPVC